MSQVLLCLWRYFCWVYNSWFSFSTIFFVFQQLTVIFLDVNLLEYILLGINWASLMCRLMFFIKVGKFFGHFFQVFFLPLPLLSFCYACFDMLDGVHFSFVSVPWLDSFSWPIITFTYALFLPVQICWAPLVNLISVTAFLRNFQLALFCKFYLSWYSLFNENCSLTFL